MPINFDHTQNIINTNDGNLDFNMTGAVKVPTGTTGQQPANITGYIRFNSTTNFFEGYDGTSWVLIGNTDADTWDGNQFADYLNQPVRTTDTVTFDNIAVTTDITTVDAITFNTTAGVTPAPGKLSWNDSSGTLNVGLKGGEVVIQLGQEVVVRVYNDTGNTLNNGEVVRITGSFSGTITAVLASASSETSSTSTIGIVTEPILSTAEGYITLLGIVRDVDTSLFAAGDEVWLSTTPGGITNVKPQSPDHPIRLGLVAVSDEFVGQIFASVSTPSNAVDVSYDNSASLLVATNVQSGIDELQASKASVAQLSSNIILYGTSAIDGGSGYNISVSETDDPNYDEPAVDASTGPITSNITPTLITSFISPVGIIEGNPGAITVTSVGNIRKTSGTFNASFFVEYYKRDNVGAETLLGTTNQTIPITSSVYNEYSVFELVTSTTFLPTDYFITKLYAIKDTAGGLDPVYDLQLGGTHPARTLIPVPVSVIPSDIAIDILVDTSNFTNVLSGADSNVQAALDTIDDHTHTALYEAKNANIQFHIASTSNPHAVTQTQVGLSNVDNTSDLNKPISTATQTALDLKLNSSAYTAADVLAKLITVDGSTSGLDADLLDGIDSTGFALVGHNHTFDSLSNVTITTIASGEIPKWSGSAWINNTLAEAGISATGHTHVSSDITDATSANTANTIVERDVSGNFSAGTITATAFVGPVTGTVSDISNHSTTNLSEGTNLYFTNERVDDRVNDLFVAGSNITLTYNDIANTFTVAATAGATIITQDEGIEIDASASTLNFVGAGVVVTDAGAGVSTITIAQGAISALNDIGNVTITTNTTGEILKWSGTAWINNTLAEAGISATGHTHTAIDITDFDTEVSNNSSVVANTAKVTNVSTDLGYTTGATTGSVTSSDGTDATLPAATTTLAGLLTGADKTKLDGIDTGATDDQTAGEIEAIVSHDNLLDFIANEHIDWTSDQGATNIHLNNLPATALTTVQTAVSEIAQLALTTEEGDVVVRSDENKTYMHNGGIAGTMADFTLLATPTDAVTSVNGASGVVILTHDGFTDYVANEHIDWTSDQGATNIHAGNYTDTNTTYVSSDFDHDNLTGFVANEHIDWTIDQGATNIHAGNYTDTVYTHPSDGVDLGAALTGANVISDVNVNAAGHVTGFATRALTTSDIGGVDIAETIYGKNAMSTGIKTGGELSIDVDTTKFDISAGTGYVIDNTTDPSATSPILVSWSAFNAQTVTNILTQPVTYISITSAGAIVQATNFPDAEDRRTNIFLGVVVHSDNTVINVINNLPVVAYDVGAQLQDLMNSFGFRSESGNLISANGINLSIDKTAGIGFKPGVNFHINPKIPHEVIMGALTAATFRYRNQDSSEGGDVTVVDPTTYDNAGTTTTVPSDDNATIQRVYIFPSNIIRVQRGQEVFATLGDAIDSVGREDFVVETNISENGLLLASIVTKKTASDLTNAAEAKVIPISTTTTGSVGFTTTLQQSYDVSPTPEIITNSTSGALTVQRGSAADTDNVLEINNGAASTVLAVTGQGNVTISGSLSIAGNTAFHDGYHPFVSMTTTPPGSPLDGDLWFDTDNGSLYVYFNDGNTSQWVEVSGQTGAGGPSGGSSPFVDTGTYVYYGGALNVGIGTATPSEALHVIGNILASEDVIAYSDRRLKENIFTYDNALETVRELRGVRFNKINNSKTSIGLIAQEVNAVLPEAVHIDEASGYLSVAYGNIVGVLVEAIKEQDEEIDTLKAMVKALTERLDKIDGGI